MQMMEENQNFSLTEKNENLNVNEINFNMDINNNLQEKNDNPNMYNNNSKPQMITDMNNKKNQVNPMKIQRKTDKKRMDNLYNDTTAQLNNQRQNGNGPLMVSPINNGNNKNVNANMNMNNANINNPNNIAYMGGNVNGGNNNVNVNNQNQQQLQQQQQQPQQMDEMSPQMMYGTGINGKDEQQPQQQNLSPYMYYNYNNFVPYPYFPMATAAADGSFYQPIPAQMPATHGTQAPTTPNVAMYSSPHPHPPTAAAAAATAMIPMNRIPSNSSIPTSEVLPTASPNNGIPVTIPGAAALPTNNIPAIPPPMTAAPVIPGIMPRMPYFQPQMPSSPLPMMPSNFNGAQPFSPTSNHGAPPYGPMMNPMGSPSMNGGGNRYHYSKNYHHINNNNSHGSGYNGKNSQTTNNIYIRGLDQNITDESLQEMCKKWGTIVSSKAIIDNQSKECKGYGFVMYKNEEQARLAMTELNKMGYQVSFAKESFSTRLKNLQDNVSTNIYMSNLPLDMTEEKFLELFAPHKVISSIILYDQTGASRGVGLAKLESRENAQSIIDKYTNVILPGAKNPLQVRFADSIAQKKLKGQAYHKKNNYYNNQDYLNQYPRDSMVYYSQYGSMNNFGMRNKMPMAPQLAYMSQPVWPMMADPSMPMGLANSPYMMGPQMNQGMMEAGNNPIMGNEGSPMTEPNTQGNNGPALTENQMNNNPIQESTNDNGMTETYTSKMPLKNMNHQEIEFNGMIEQNAEQNCIASAVESEME